MHRYIKKYSSGNDPSYVLMKCYLQELNSTYWRENKIPNLRGLQNNAKSICSKLKYHMTEYLKNFSKSDPHRIIRENLLSNLEKSVRESDFSRRGFSAELKVLIEINK